MMRTHRSMFLVALLLLSLASAAWAQQQLAALKKTTPQQRADLLTKMMQEKLNLSGDTVQQVAKINLEYANKMQPILESSERPLQELREARAINEEKEAALKQVLSADQFKKYLAAKAGLEKKFEQHFLHAAKAKAGNANPPQ